MRNLETKKDIRKRILKERKEIDPAAWQRDTDAVTEAVIGLDVFREATDLYCYVDFKGEVGTRALMQEAWRLGKTVWVPRVSGMEMEFYEITSLGQLAPGTFGVPEPAEGVPGSARDGLMIMPGVAFDSRRNRVGYGKGYYDRYLEKHPGLDTIAICFDMQIVEEVPSDPLDIRPRILITESSVYKDEL